MKHISRFLAAVAALTLLSLASSARAADSAVVNLSLTPPQSTSVTLGDSEGGSSGGGSVTTVLAPVNMQEAFAADGFTQPGAITGTISSNAGSVAVDATAGSGSLHAGDLYVGFRGDLFQMQSGVPVRIGVLQPGDFAIDLSLVNYRSYPTGTTYTNTVTLTFTVQ